VIIKEYESDIGKLQLIKILDKRKRGYNRVGLFKCFCGNEFETVIADVKRRNTKSCGCYKTKYLKERLTIHNKSKTTEFSTWSGMKNRCYNKNTKEYFRYGKRGIIVCDRWKYSFENFLEDMGLKPEPKNKYSIHRINNNGNYEKSNCKWATGKEQNSNRRNTIFLEYNGEIKSNAEWAREYNLLPYQLRHRIELGWPIKKALETPIRKINNVKTI
jgi:hypothetical protein